jgi:hypothetical protein
MAEDQAEVAAEIAGASWPHPWSAAPGRSGRRADPLVAGGGGRSASEAEANAAQIEARLGLKPGIGFDANLVPEVQNAKAGIELAQNEFNRIRSLLDERVVSQSEFDQRRTQMEAARQQ